MKKGICFVSTAAALLVLVAGMGFGGPATASQSIDPCYKACFLKDTNRSTAEKQDCNRRCRASDRYKCDSKCFKIYANSPNEQYACRKKCVGLPGGW
jgi:hypothetical protein